MNAHSLVPLIASIAYVPLLVVLLMNRPWQPRQRLFFLFLVPAVFWSASDMFFRSDFFSHDKLLLVKIVLASGVWMGIQYRYFIQSFHKSDAAIRPFAHIILAACIGLAALGYIPEGITITPNNILVDYGVPLIAIAAVLGVLTGRDTYHLLRKLRVSDDAGERNQIIYLFVGLACLATLGIITFQFSARGYPVGHIGNFLNACVLTYAVVAHKLLDIRVVVRQAVVSVVLYGSGIGMVLLAFWLAHRFIGFEFSVASVALTLGLGIPAIFLMVRKLGATWRPRIEGAFVGERYSYRKQLSDFVTKIHSVPTLEQFGSDFVSLVSQSVGCQRACLLLPQVDDRAFVARFTYPPVEDNPIKELKLRSDNPIVIWLQRERILLPERSISIDPEFKSIWQEEREAIGSAAVRVFVPLIHMGELVGVLAVGERRDGRPYTLEDTDLLEYITAQVAASMEKEYFHEQLREQDREITLINQLTTIITSSVSIQEIFDRFIQELKKVVEIDWAAIALIDENELCVSAVSQTVGSAWQPGERISLEGTGTEYVCREKKSLYEADLARYHRFWVDERHMQQGIRSVLYLPLSIKDQGIGSLVLASGRPNAYSGRQIKLLEQVARQIATPIENAQLYARAEQRSRIDELTGLFNRRHFEERLKEETARHSRYGNSFSIFLLDLDSFKTYNDVYGHPSGDVLLGQIGKIIKSSIRDADQAFRYGGDEFVVVLPHTAVEDARVVADRVRETIAAEMERKGISVTCSIGLACYPSDGVMAGELVTVADTALYFAKRTGGNRVYVSSKILAEPLDDAGTYARRNGLSAIYALVSAVEAKDPYTYGHSKRVNSYGVALAEAIGLSPEEVSRVSIAALLHDIGKIGVSDKVLNKKGKLTKEDWEAVKSHPRLGATIVGNVPNLVPCVSSILHHHERWDGTGYPDGLKGEQIPIEARILAIADSFEAMSAARPYRPALCSEKVLKELHRGAGSQFDPKLVEVFIAIIEAGLPEKVKAGQNSSAEVTNP